MAEAERLCARIGFLARGKLVAEGTAQELVAQAKAETLDDAFIKLTGEELSDKDGDVVETIAAEG
jgi:ABC-type multidrug transport system ATPase subunit